MSFWSDIVLAVESAMGGESNVEQTSGPATATVPSVPGLGGFVTVIEAIWTELTDGRMWRSLGWVILGIVLMLLGAGLWIGPSAARRSPLGMAARELG
jgi:hypothetical protein